MIVKATHALRRAVLHVPDSGLKFVSHPGAFPEKHPDLSNIISLIPEWLTAMLIDGNVIVLDSQEYLDLQPEIKEHLEVLSP